MMTAQNQKVPTTGHRFPIVEYAGRSWFFDDQLKQLRNVNDPHDFKDLDETEVFIFRYHQLLKEIEELVKAP